MDRPDEDRVDIFDKLKLPSYQKALAYNNYHKRKN